jgi:hypothetical protein
MSKNPIVRGNCGVRGCESEATVEVNLLWGKERVFTIAMCPRHALQCTDAFGASAGLASTDVTTLSDRLADALDGK